MLHILRRLLASSRWAGGSPSRLFRPVHPPDIFCFACGCGHEARRCYPGRTLCAAGRARPAGLSQRYCRIWCSARPTGGYLLGFIPAAFSPVSRMSPSCGAPYRGSCLCCRAHPPLRRGMADCFYGHGAGRCFIIGMAVFVPGEAVKAAPCTWSGDSCHDHHPWAPVLVPCHRYPEIAPGITSMIGPNGSGKSRLLKSVRVSQNRRAAAARG